MYASRRSPKPLLDEIINYQPAKPKASSWNEIYKRICDKEDDGHGSKLIRAVSHGEQVSRPYQDDLRFRIRGEMWQKLGNMGKQK